ncbi:MAG: DUF5666 domain-containing protein [Thermodesulfobacteriota bacterium]
MTKLVIFILILLPVGLGFSQTKGETISFSGTIESISADYKFIVVNNVNILISSSTKIVNERGYTLKAGDLKSELYVVIHGVQSSNGFLAKKIIVTKPPAV